MCPAKNPRGNESKDEVSALAQNYLLTIYMLDEESTSPITISRIAGHLARSPVTEHLGTAVASVAAMVRRMQRDGLLEVGKGKHITFTPQGRKLADQSMRRHQLAERMLVDVLGMDLHKVHAEAHRWEHAISPDVEAHIVERLGNPKTCPFGHPIPGSDYKPPASVQPLSQIAPNTSVVVDRIPEYDPRFVQYLVANGLIRGNRLTVREIAAYKGTMTLDVAGREVIVGMEVAPSIMVHSPAPAK